MSAIPNKLSAVDLFCGSGGMSAGLINAGIEVVAAYDAWISAVQIYNHNIDNHSYCLDLSNVAESVKRIKPLNVDMIAGGPPCQDFSTAGKRIEGNRASLTISFAKIITKCQPFMFLMENVQQARNSKAYQSMRTLLESNGYLIQEIVLNASYYGVPQARKRFFSFGYLSRKSNIGKLFMDWVLENKSEHPLTVKEYLQDEIDIEYYYRHPRNYSRRAIFSVNEPSPTIRGVNRPVPPNYKGNHLDSAPPNSVRPLTTQERSRVQTFPKSWNWSGGDRNSDVETQIGNAVPPNLAKFIGMGIMHAIK